MGTGSGVAGASVADVILIAIGVVGMTTLLVGLWEYRRATQLHRQYEAFAFNLSTTLQTIRWAVERADIMRSRHDPEAPSITAFAEGMRNCAAQLGVPPERLPTFATAAPPPRVSGRID